MAPYNICIWESSFKKGLWVLLFLREKYKSGSILAASQVWESSLRGVKLFRVPLELNGTGVFCYCYAIWYQVTS